MNPALTAAGKRVLLATGHYARRLARDTFPGVLVLCYHGVRGDDEPESAHAFSPLHVRASELEAHCRLLRATCHPIALDAWRAALAGGPPLPDRPVLLTSGRSLLWYDALARRDGEAAVDRAKRLPHPAWRLFAAPVAVEDSHPQAVLTPDELRALDGPLEVGGHTTNHPILARAPLDEQRAEITGDRDRLASWCGRAPRAFAYPNGRPGEDYHASTVRLVGEAGYDFGFTTREGFAVPSEPPLERSRFLMLAGVSAAELAHRLCYSWRRKVRA
jgi:hypothetical protein